MAWQEQTASRNIFGNYEIVGTVGRGGMGIVYRAMDTALDRVVALKVLRSDRRSHPILFARFEREAQAIAQLDHPHIVETYRAGSAHGIPFIAMELVKGAPLSDVMRQEHRLPWERALAIADQVADALGAAHAHQIIHRDIKPPNVIVGEDDHVYVTDFGLAKLLTAENQLTAEGTRLGTPQYMSPEQCQNKDITAASDLYSLGVLIFVMISGRLPYKRQDRAQLIMTIISGETRRLRKHVPDVPEDVDRLVAYLLEKDPSDRPQTAEAVRDAIARIRAGKPLDISEHSARDALADFREELGDTPTPAPSTTSHETVISRGESALLRLLSQWGARWRKWPKPARKAVVFGMVGVMGLIGGLMAASSFRADPGVRVEPAPSADPWRAPASIAAFESGRSASLLTARFNLTDFAVVGATWITSDAVLVQLDGLSGTPREGQHTFCAVCPGTQTASLALPPTGGSGSAYTASLIGSAATGGDHALFANRFVVQYDGPGLWVVAHGTSSRTAPARLRFPAMLPGHALTSTPPARVACLAVHPQGKQVMACVQGEDDEGWELARCPVSPHGVLGTPVLVAGAGRMVCAIQYAPDGRQIAYLRESEDGDRELWTAPANGAEFDGRMLMAGQLDLGPGAFSPDGTRLIVAERADEKVPRLYAVSAADGGLAATFPRCVAGAWQASSSRLVAMTVDEQGAKRLSMVSVGDPEDAAFLTSGIHRFCGISPDGQWAAVLPEPCNGSAVAFVRMPLANS